MDFVTIQKGPPEEIEAFLTELSDLCFDILLGIYKS